MGADRNPFRFLGPLDLLVLQPTPFCNLDCSYCYLPNRNSRRRMPEQVLELIFQQVFSSAIADRRFTVVWHAGEPMVVPVEYYERAIAIIAAHNHAGIEVGHSFQTNGVLIDREWCDFIVRHRVNVGVSVDGPDFIHDRYRKTRAGRPTHARVMAGIDRLRERAIPFHVISVLTRDSLDYPDELYDFYAEHGIHEVAFNIEEIEGPHAGSSLLAAGAEERFARFIGRFYDLARGGDFAISVREFDSMMPILMAPPEHQFPLTQENAPYSIISVDCDGNFTTYSPELLGLRSAEYGDFVIGNVRRDSIVAAAAGPSMSALSAAIARGVNRCAATCEYFRYCGGGAPVNKYFENGSFDSTETLFCRLNRKVMIDVLLARLEQRAHPAAPG
jgi:uncharacterized protein